MGEADDSVAGGLHGGVAGAIALEGGAVLVEFEAVELDDEVVRGPEGVYLAAQDEDVVRRGGKIVLTAEEGKAILERRPGSLERLGSGDDLSASADATPPRVAVAGLRERLHLEQPEAVCLLADAPEARFVENLGEVEERSRQRGHRNTGTGGSFVWSEAPPMKPDPTAPGSAMLGGHIDRTRSGSHEPPEGRCCPVAQGRTFSAGKNGGHPVAVPSQSLVTDCVDPGVQPMQGAKLESIRDRPAAEAERFELSSRDRTMLAGGEPGELAFALRTPLSLAL